jgi:hypothetical protein
LHMLGPLVIRLWTQHMQSNAWTVLAQLGQARAPAVGNMGTVSAGFGLW